MVPIALLALVATPTMGSASELEPEPRVSASASYAVERLRNGEPANLFVDGLSVSARVLRRVGRSLAVGAQVGYHGQDTYSYDSDDDYPGFRGPNHLGMWEVSPVVRWRLGEYRFHPYVLAGPGLYLTEKLTGHGVDSHNVPRAGFTTGFGLYGFIPAGLGAEFRWHRVWNADQGPFGRDVNLLIAAIAVNVP
jgi:hypothetical protein